MIDSNETHEKIINYLKKEGPSLPVQISKELEMSSLFISAFLSELSKEKRIKVTSLKVGGSPLYFVEGQEKKLELFYKYLHPKESEAFILLKKNKVLKDSEQSPAIRVALRSIKDFATGFKIKEEIYWKYNLVEESEINKILNPETKDEEESEEKSETNMPSKKLIPSSENDQETNPSKIIEKVKMIQTPNKKIIPQTNTNNSLINDPPQNNYHQSKERKFNNPLIIPEEKKKKEKPKSEFAIKTIEYIRNLNLNIIEEREFKAREYTCITRINSELGKINFFTQSRDKKSITEADLKKLLSVSQSIPLPALLIYTGKIGKKAMDFANKYPSILKLRKMNVINNNNL